MAARPVGKVGVAVVFFGFALVWDFGDFGDFGIWGFWGFWDLRCFFCFV